MKQASSYAPYVAAFAFFALSVSILLPSAGAAEFLVPSQNYPKIQNAVNAAAAGDSVVVAPGTYQEAITLTKGVTVRGLETARTFLSGGGSGTIITASGLASAATISGFTFINASFGIQVLSSPSSTLSITNNVFEVGTAGTAINVQGSDLTEVINNVFYQNATAISRDADIVIANNIFSTNTTAIGNPLVSAINSTINAFFDNGTDGPSLAPVSGDPLFVDPLNSDFHLQAGSPCIDTGDPTFGDDIIDFSPPDIGAYGGPTADPTPFPVAGLSGTSATATSISLSWSPNNCYLVTDPIVPGGYSIWYGYASGDYTGQDAGFGAFPSPIDVLATDVTVLTPEVGFTLPDLTPPAVTIAAPVLNQPVSLNAQLALTWSAVPGAEGYKVHYGNISRAQNTVDVGNTTSYTLSGLTNGIFYHVAVSAYARTKYFIAITDFYGVDFGVFAHESAFSPEVSVPVGAAQDGAISNEWIEFPEAATPYPLLPNSHGACFIATAAYGDYSAPEVQALRAFRDLYLLTNGPGRLFVQWYYRNGPAAAALLNAHPGFKPVVRAALLPAVGAAIFLTETPAAAKFLVLLITGSAIALGFSRKRRSRTGGLR